MVRLALGSIFLALSSGSFLLGGQGRLLILRGPYVTEQRSATVTKTVGQLYVHPHLDSLCLPPAARSTAQRSVHNID